MGLNGILNVNKPQGPTSFKIISILRTLTGEKKIGHAGTLDPMATGVLPVCFGQATRISEYIMGGSKEYIAGIELGKSTDTYDGEGVITGYGDVEGITLTDIQEALNAFSGTIKQSPPAFSAIKIKGKPSYSLARKGLDVQHCLREIHIDFIKILEFNLPRLVLHIQCGKGTYIRSLANDLGEMLGCRAYLKDLCRNRCGLFDIRKSFTLKEIEEFVLRRELVSFLYPIDFPIQNWQATNLSYEQSNEILKGLSIKIDDSNLSIEQLVRTYDHSGRFIAILKFISESGLWHPEKVFLES